MQLDLLGHADPVVQQIRKAVGAAGPGLDRETQLAVFVVIELRTWGRRKDTSAFLKVLDSG